MSSLSLGTMRGSSFFPYAICQEPCNEKTDLPAYDAKNRFPY